MDCYGSLTVCASVIVQNASSRLDSVLYGVSGAGRICSSVVTPDLKRMVKSIYLMATEGTGAGCARDMGQGWKVSPSVVIRSGQTYTIADIEGPGAIQSMWLSGDVARKGPLSRFYILRIYWDNQEIPSVECPIADFFTCGWGKYTQINSIPVVVNPNRGYNCFWEMPFRKKCRITLENRHREDITHYYQVNYTLTDVKASPFPYTFIIEMANGSTCYLPTRKAFEKGGYELDFSSKVYGVYSMTADTQNIIEDETIKILNCL